MKRLHQLSVLVIYLFLNSSLWAQNADYFRAAAYRGDKVAQYGLGYCYYKGDGVLKDYRQAVYWWTKSANQGYALAQNNLGTCYQYGDGVTQDLKQAVYWYTKAANQGNYQAQANLGGCYFSGEGVMQDYKQAVYWWTKAANQGDVMSQNNLGVCYENGEGVAQDYKQAVYWYTKAANQGNALAQSSLGNCYNRGEGVTQDHKQAVYWFTKAANQEHAWAQMKLGYCYYLGEGVAKDYKQAVYWSNKAINNPNASDKTKTLAKLTLDMAKSALGDASTTESTNNKPTQTSTSQPKQTTQSSSTNSSSYSSNSYSSGKYSRWPLFYSNPVFGFRFGYAQRAFRRTGSVMDINVENPPYLNVFGEHGVMNGFQAGFFIIPSRKNMLTVTFGLNYEMYFCSVKNAQSYNREYKEINLYAPFDLSFHVPFSRRSALYVRGGLGFDYSCYNDYSFLERNEYGRNASDKFNISWECGLDLKIQGLILYANFQKGITKRYLYGSGNPMELDKMSIGLAFGF